MPYRILTLRVALAGLALVALCLVASAAEPSIGDWSDADKMLRGALRDMPFEVGDRQAPDRLAPHVALMPWNEDRITIEADGALATAVAVGVVQPEADKVSLDAPAVKMEWVKSDDALRWLITFKSKPASNVYRMRLGGNWDDFHWWYQTPFPSPETYIEDGVEYLLQREIPGDPATDHRRCRDVDGSYAVYHKTHRNHAAGGTNYRCGKAFHVYVPKATDAGGKSVWCTLHIENGVYAVTVPQEFLDAATYPVTVNDTFGETGIGDSSTSFSDFWLGLTAAPSGGDGNITTAGNDGIYVALNNDDNYCAALYDESDDSFLVDTAERAGNNDDDGSGYTKFTLDAQQAVTNAHTYYIVWVNNPVGSNKSWYDDTPEDCAYTNDHVYTGGSADMSGADPITWDDETYKHFSAYVTYTPSAGGGVAPHASYYFRMRGQ